MTAYATAVTPTAGELEMTARGAADVACLVGVAVDLAIAADAGETGRIHVLAAVLRALAVQAKALHDRADSQWMVAYLAGQALVQEGGAS